ncbi:hypothetical protein ACQP2T_61540 [Nonomuraea sp. CA-143628]|uniref:hypothetical protein n=1 Tax=Nonomuraea sp. CA-143628 TaxID=3239997 RepID=UPI003D8E2CA3
MNETDGFKGMALTSWGATNYIRRVQGGQAVLMATHAPADCDAPDAWGEIPRCPTCRDHRGKRLAWPCPTYVLILHGLGYDTGPAIRLMTALGIKPPKLPDVWELIHQQKERNA